MPANSIVTKKSAPAPTSNSLGAAIHHTVDGQANFWDWFQGSRAVDGLGRPLVLFHGTYPWETDDGRSLGNVFAFDRMTSVNIVRRAHSIDTVGSWFSSNPGGGGAEMYGTTIYPVYLDIKAPHETTFQLLLRRARLLANGADDGRMIGQVEVDALRRWLKAIGKDGIKIVHDPADRSSTEFARQDAWIALEPDQIKSAIGNDGSFRPGCALLAGRSQDVLEPAPPRPAPKASVPAAQATDVRAAGASGPVRLAARVDSAPPPAAATTSGPAPANSDGFRSWFAQSKVTDESGAPLRVFHGTKSDVASFSHEFIGDGHGAGDWGDGFYFTNSIDAANRYAEGPGGNVIPVYLRLQNPADRAVMLSPRVQDALDDDMGFEGVAEVLASMGHDGVIIDHGGGDKEYVVFDPAHIKSAISNSGTYSLTEHDITDGVDPPRQIASTSIAPLAQAAAITMDAQGTADAQSPFAQWFGQSKVTDEKGRPKVVYHGTVADHDFRSFWTHPGTALGAHFGTAEQANDLANFEQSVDSADEAGARVMPVYLSLRNPLRLIDPGTGAWNTDAVGSQLFELGILSEEVFEGSDYLAPDEYGRAMREAIESAGHDGIVYLNRREGIDADRAAEGSHLDDLEFKRSFLNSRDSYIAFRPTQIKSAIGNSGSFSPDCDDITDQSTRPELSRTEPPLEAIAPQLSIIESAPGAPVASLLDTQAFRQWFDQSKAVNPDGSPRLMFHGTRSEIRSFDVAHFGRTDGGWAGEGFYFSPDPEEASTYACFVSQQHGGAVGINGANVIPVHLRINNPLEWRLGTEESLKIQAKRNVLGPKGFVQWARSCGHDGVHITSHRIGKAKPEDQWIVFDPGQIKSAISNTGRFAPDCPDITDGVGLVPEMRQESADTRPGRQAPTSTEFRAWFGDSKVVDQHGKPIVAYHGTGNDFRAFELNRRGANYRWSKGFYFSANPDVAAGYAMSHTDAQPARPGLPGIFTGSPADTGKGGANIIPVYLSLKNPLVRTARGNLSPDQSADRHIDKWLEEAKKGGHDGLIVNPSQSFKSRGPLYIAFHPSDIKSAISNTGRYAPNCDDITDGAGVTPKLQQQGSAGVRAEQNALSSPDFRAWFGDSKVLDQSGQPQVLFHGASRSFKVFRPSKQGTYGPGIYFANSEETARTYLPGIHDEECVMQVYVSLRNPWVITGEFDSDACNTEDWDNPILEAVLALPKGRKIIDEAKSDERFRTYGHFGPRLQRHLRELGYDGIIGTYSDGSQEVVAFHPSQVKSATHNSGAYSPDSNDITDGAKVPRRWALR